MTSHDCLFMCLADERRVGLSNYSCPKAKLRESEAGTSLVEGTKGLLAPSYQRQIVCKEHPRGQDGFENAEAHSVPDQILLETKEKKR